MTTDLYYLAYTAILTAALWIPYVVSQGVSNGMLTADNYVDPTPRPLPNWGKRADRTYLNAVEVFGAFATLILIAHVTGKANETTALLAASFFWLRLAYSAVYLLGIPYLRTMLFALGFFAEVGIFWQLIK